MNTINNQVYFQKQINMEAKDLTNIETTLQVKMALENQRIEVDIMDPNSDGDSWPYNTSRCTEKYEKTMAEILTTIDDNKNDDDKTILTNESDNHQMDGSSKARIGG